MVQPVYNLSNIILQDILAVPPFWVEEKGNLILPMLIEVVKHSPIHLTLILLGS